MNTYYMSILCKAFFLGVGERGKKKKRPCPHRDSITIWEQNKLYKMNIDIYCQTHTQKSGKRKGMLGRAVAILKQDHLGKTYSEAITA